MKRIIPLMLVLALCLGMLAGCGNQKSNPASTNESIIETVTTQAPEEKPVQEAPTSVETENSAELTETVAEPVVYDLPLTDTPTEFSIVSVKAPDFMSAYIGTDGSYNTAASNRYLEEQTGIRIKYIEYDMFSYAQNFNLLIAAGDYPDMLSSLDGSYGGGITKALDDDVIIDLTDYVMNDMPAYYQAVENADVWSEIMTDEGQILTINSISSQEVINRGPMIRKDWLDAQNLEVPTTYDELTEVGAALKSAYDLDYAFFVSALVNPDITLSAGYDLPGFDINTSGSSFYHEGGQVKSCLVSEDLRDYLKYLNSWYQKGLISKDFFTRYAADVKDAFAGGQCAVCWDNADYITEHNQNEELIAQGFHCVGLPVTRKDEDQTLHFSLGMGNFVGEGVSISTNCEDPELLITLMDWFFTEPGINLCNYGIEGTSYDVDADGHAVWSKNVTEADVLFRLALVDYTFSGMPSLWDEQRYWSEIYDEDAYAAVDLWQNVSNDKAWTMPSALYYTTEEATAYAMKMSDVETRANEFILSAVIGEVDVDAAWDSYVEEIWSLGLQDCIDAKQGAYDRYLTRTV